MSTLKPPFRAEQVGSLPRPERLMIAREDFAANKITRQELTKIEDECIGVAVAMRLPLSFELATSGAKSEPMPAFSTWLGRCR